MSTRPWSPAEIRQLCEAEALLTVDDVARVVGRSRSAIYAWIARGPVPFRVYKLGNHRSWLIPSADLLALVEANPPTIELSPETEEGRAAHARPST